MVIRETPQQYRARVRVFPQATCPLECCWSAPQIVAAAERAIGDVVDAEWWEQETKKRRRER